MLLTAFPDHDLEPFVLEKPFRSSAEESLHTDSNQGGTNGIGSGKQNKLLRSKKFILTRGIALILDRGGLQQSSGWAYFLVQRSCA